MFQTPRRFLLIAAALALASLLAGCVFVPLLEPGDPAPGGSLHHVVRQAAANDGSVAVLVSLREPPALRSRRPDVAALRAQVASSQAPVLAALPAADAQVIYRYQAVPALALRVNERALEALSRRPEVIDISLDEEGSAGLLQSVPLINADDAHFAGVTGAGIIVAVLDTGIDTNHPDLAGDIAYERCFLGGANGPGCPAAPHRAEDDQGHGTNVSGIITSTGTISGVGVAPDANIAAYKILNSSGTGFPSDWIAALDDIIANHPEVDIVNMSLQSGSGCPGGSLATAITTLRSTGVATFISAGNQGTKNTLTVPGCIPEGISVGAVYDANVGTVNGWKIDCADFPTAADDVACWSSSASSLDLLGPGARTTSTGLGGGTSTFLGTSQAAPHAAGVAALLLEAHPGLSVDEIEARMEATGKLVTDDLNDADAGTNRTTPRIDARVALLADNDDTDGDGCANIEEYGTNGALGGRRNPLSPYDFYDTNSDRVVNVLDDVLTVIQAFGPSGGPNYQASLDRSPRLPGTDGWDLGPPDGTIDVLTDVAGVGLQFGHSCAAPP